MAEMYFKKQKIFYTRTMFTRGSKSWLIFQKPLHVLTRSILERKFDLSSINKCNIYPK
jgi:hypothetical protein